MLITSVSAGAQVVSFNTQVLGVGYNGANSFNSVCFVIQNTNPYPAVLTSVSNYFAAAGSGNAELWYSSSSLYGAPGTVALPNWTLIATNPVSVAAGVQTVLFPALSFTIPGNTTYRFYLATPSITLNYTTAPGPTPNVFTNTGINLQVGDFQNLGQFAGWAGAYPTPLNNPRSFTGTVTLNLLATPCAGTPTAGTASALPAAPCPGVPVTLNLAGQTAAANLAFQWLQSPTGLPGSYTPIVGATTVPYSYTPAPGSTNYFRCIVTCTNPGGGFDTSIASGSCIVQPWSPTGNCWCIPTYVNGGGGDNIANVTLGTLTNNTAAAGNVAPYWVDYTPQQVANALATPNLYVGLASNLSVTHGTDLTQYLGVWIDFNHSGSFEPSEYFSPGTDAGPNGVHVLPITAPPGSLPGLTRMRLRGGDDAQMTNLQPCGPTNSTFGEAEDYLVNIIPASNHDPAVTAITGAAGNCYAANVNMVLSVTNYGSQPITVATNPITCTLAVTGPLGVNYYYGNVNPALTLNPYAANTVPVLIPGVNLYAGGTYYINSTLSIGNAGGVVNGSLQNDSLPSPLIRINYRPTAGPNYNLCQYASIPFGQGLTVSGCATPINDSLEITFTVTPTPDNVGATTGGTSQTVPGAACANQFAGNFANATPVPALPPGASFTQNGVLTVTNLSSSFITEPRFILYSGAPVVPTLFAPCPQGYNANAGDIVLAGLSTGNNANFTNTRHITPAQLGSIFSYLQANPLAPLNVGYFETWNDNQNTSDIGVNAGAPTVVKLKVYYQYVPSAYEWYNVPSGGASLYSLSPFDPIITPGSGINNSNTPGTYTFYAACVGSSSCRVPVSLVINPSPAVFQDTIALCESPAGSNGAIFDLTTVDGPVSGFAAGVTVQYYGDQGLFYLLPTPTNDTSASTVVYSKVTNLAGCSATDSVVLQVNPQPEFPALYVTGNACAPASIDVATLIDPFATVPPGTDTLYFSDAACTIPHPNPHNVTVSDTVYIVLATNTVPVCADTAIALIELSTAGALIANQDILNYSIPGFVGCNTLTLSDGVTDTLYNPADCKRIVHITDVANATSLGSTTVCEWIDASTQVHNGQPYVNRHYQITPSTQTSANVCLYFLEDDFAQFNSFSLLNGWPQITPNVNLVISKVDNGDITTPGHTAIAIPNANITTSYDPLTTVWTVCFPVDSFSYFYAHAANPGNVPLPISLLSFSGKKIENTSLLNWVTSSEQNNSHFVLENSKDGKTFTALSGKIASKALGGNSAVSLAYDYTDGTPYAGHNYYRLQQVDLDGKISYSKVVDVYHGNETLVTLYPNPVNTQLNIEINTPKATLAQVKILDATGRVVKAIDMQLQAGNNKTDIGMEGLADGVYMVKVTNQKGLNFSQTIRKN